MNLVMSGCTTRVQTMALSGINAEQLPELQATQGPKLKKVDSSLELVFTLLTVNR